MSELIILSALAIGLSLGIFGSGGAILTLPTLIYLLGYSEKHAIIGSLFIVAIVSLFSAVPQVLKNGLSKAHLLYFALPGLFGSYVGAFLGANASPKLQMMVFVALMILAAIKMLSIKTETETQTQTEQCRTGLVLIMGALVGVVTGFIGVGGGFLIVPALVLLSKLSINKAISTSVTIIFLQSSVGLLSYYQHSEQVFNQIQWPILLAIAAIGVLGSLLGVWLKQFINQTWLTRLFGWFLVLMACFIVLDKLL